MLKSHTSSYHLHGKKSGKPNTQTRHHHTVCQREIMHFSVICKLRHESSGSRSTSFIFTHTHTCMCLPVYMSSIYLCVHINPQYHECRFIGIRIDKTPKAPFHKNTMSQEKSKKKSCTSQRRKQNTQRILVKEKHKKEFDCDSSFSPPFVLNNNLSL